MKQHVSVILTSRDKITNANGNCLSINQSTKREELTRKWIAKRFVIRDSLDNNNSARAIRGSECRLKVERTQKTISKTQKLKLSKNSGLKQVDDKSMGKRTTSLLLSSGKRGSIRYNDEFIGVKCIRGGSGRYQVEIIVDSNRGGVSTAISLTRGQKINIGQIVNESKNKSKSISLDEGINLTKNKKDERFVYYLMID